MRKLLYLEIKNYVIRHIKSGTWGVGDRIPSESSLAKQFNVSRMTANRAYKELQGSGVLVRVAGSGSFVAPTRMKNEFLTIRDIADELKDVHRNHKMNVLERKSVKADQNLAKNFETKVGEKIFFASICHLSDGLPILLERRWVCASSLPDFEHVELTETSTYQYLMNAAPLQRAEHSVRAVNADKYVSEILRIKSGNACLVLQRRTWSQRRIVSCADLIYVGNRYELTGSFIH